MFWDEVCSQMSDQVPTWICLWLNSGICQAPTECMPSICFFNGYLHTINSKEDLRFGCQKTVMTRVPDASEELQVCRLQKVHHRHVIKLWLQRELKMTLKGLAFNKLVCFFFFLTQVFLVATAGSAVIVFYTKHTMSSLSFQQVIIGVKS